MCCFKISVRRLFLLLVIGGLNCSPSNAADSPNIILMLADDIGAECFRTYGGTLYSTPNIDSLAAQGIQFNNFYSQPKCTHTRLELMTGKYNSRNYTKWATLGTAQFSVADLLRIAGYRTGFAGKWQLGYNETIEVTPADVGFQQSWIWTRFASANWYAGATVHDNRNFRIPRRLRKNRLYTGYGPDILNQFAIDFIKEHHSDTQPFFLYYALRLPHGPFTPTPDHPDFPLPLVDDIKYFPSMVTYMDKLVGRIVDTVDECNIRDDTLIIFLSDNGTNRRITSTLADGSTVTGGKGKPNVREGMHVPFVASWSGTIPPGIVSNAIADPTDIMATASDITGVDMPTRMDGKTLLDDMLQVPGPDKWRRYSHYPRSFDINDVTTAAFTREYKLQRNSNGAMRFYHLPTDPTETSPLTGLTTAQQTMYDKLNDVIQRYDNIGSEF